MNINRRNKDIQHSTYFSKSIRDNGFVLITALMVIFLVMSIVSTVALITASDLRTSARARAIIKTRFVAESVSDTIYARIAGLKGGFLAEAKKYGIDESVDPPTYLNNPLHYTSPIDPWGKWFALDDNGKLKDCELKDVCFRAKMTQINTSTLVDIRTRDEVSLDLIVRGGCYGDDILNLKGCVYRQFQTRYRTRSYIDTASIANSERSLLPGVPDDPEDATKKIRVSLLKDDQISGPVQTNDPDGYLVCGEITGVDQLRYLDGGTDYKNFQDYLSSSDPYCAAPPLDSTMFDMRKEVLLPAQITTSGKFDPTYSQTVYEHLAGDNYKFNLPTNTLEMRQGDISVNGNTLKYPSNGVIYVVGDLDIEASEFNRSLTIYVEGSATIKGDIINYGSNPEHLLGIAASEEIVVECNFTPHGCENRKIEAVLVAGIRIYNDLWDESPYSGAGEVPKITIKGALVADERPVFGSYHSNSYGTLVNGWQKDITFDKRLLDNQPPFFFRTTQASIVRSSMDEGACQESTICT